MYLFQQIEEMKIYYHDARKVVAEFVLEERSRLETYSMKEVAARTYTSKPTLVRFAQSLGFSGWKEFMQAFVQEEHYQESHYMDIDANIPFTQDDSCEDIIRKITDLQVESILDTADLLETAVLEEAVSRLMKAKNVIVFGMSPNTLVGQLFRRKMATIGKIITVPISDESGTLAYALGSEDLGIIVSYSGNNVNREPMRYIPILEENKVPMIGITGGGKNYIREHIDCVIAMSSRERLYSKISNFSTESSLESIFNILYSCCFAKDYERNLTYKIHNSTALEYRRNASLNEMKEKVCN